MWRVEYSTPARKQLRKFDRLTQARILDFMDERVATRTDPRSLGKALSGPLQGLWRYRVGDYRVICRIEDSKVVIVALTIGHRREVYGD